MSDKEKIVPLVLESENKSLTSETSRKLLQKCIKEIENLDADFNDFLNQLESEARERIIASYYRTLGKDLP